MNSIEWICRTIAFAVGRRSCDASLSPLAARRLPSPTSTLLPRAARHITSNTTTNTRRRRLMTGLPAGLDQREQVRVDVLLGAVAHCWSSQLEKKMPCRRPLFAFFFLHLWSAVRPSPSHQVNALVVGPSLLLIHTSSRRLPSLSC